MATATLEVKILSPDAVLFEGRAERVILPGEYGVFEACPFHRPLVSRLVSGQLFIDGHPLAIRRGVVKVLNDSLTAIVEPAV